MTLQAPDLPAGPERRRVMRERGLNISAADFTDAENADLADVGAQITAGIGVVSLPLPS